MFRPLQYARSEIDFCDIRLHARHVVHYCGMHLEAVLRVFLKQNKMFGGLRYFNSTLGKVAHEISKLKIIDNILIEVLFKLVTLFNKAKHEVNMFEERPRLFSEADAIICYFAARIIGKEILGKLEYPLSLVTYRVNNQVLN